MAKKKKDKKKSSSSSGNDTSESDSLEIKRKNLLQTAKELKAGIENEVKTKEEFEAKLKQVQFYWNLEKEELKRKEVQLQQREAKELELVRNHEEKVEGIKEGIKELLYQQQNDLIRAKNERRVELCKVHQQHCVEQRKKQSTSIDCQQHLRNIQVSQNNFLNQLKHSHENQIRQLQDDFKINFREITVDSERKIKALAEEVDIQLKKDLAALEEKKEAKVKEVLYEHDQVRV